MGRVVYSLAAATAVVAITLTGVPASASTDAGAHVLLGSHAASHSGRVAARSQSSSPALAAEQRAISRSERLLAQLNERGSITGLVLGANGTPQPNVCVTAIGQLATRSAATEADGRFVINRLPLGAYKVSFGECSLATAMAAQWYGGASRASAAQVLVMNAIPVQLASQTLSAVAPRSTPTGAKLSSAQQISATPLQQLVIQTEKSRYHRVSAPTGANPAHIQGRVTDRAGHPVAGVCVDAASLDSKFVEVGAPTSRNGSYSLAVLAGRYYVVFNPNCAPHGNYAPQLWRDASSVAKATALHLRKGQVVKNINAVLGPGAAIAGRVTTSAAHHPSLAGICVLAQGVAGQSPFVGTALTRADGTFTLNGLATGKYQVSTFCTTGPSSYVPTSLRTPVAVTDGRTTKITIAVALGGSIAGTVKGADGHLLSGICAGAFSNTFGTFSPTGAHGAYRMEGLPAGSYQMQFITGCGNNGPYAPVTLTDPISVKLGQSVTGVNATMPLDGSLTGIVKSSSGKPLAGICVSGQSGAFFGFQATTNANGKYSANVAPGTYQVQFSAGGGFAQCNNMGNYLSVTKTATISSSVTTTLEVVLPTGGVISGLVKDRHGKPLAGICVAAVGQSGANPPIDQIVTGRDGSYRAPRLSTGPYIVQFNGGCGNTESVAALLYNGDPTFAAPTVIQVTAGKVRSGIDATMQPGGTLVGRVTDRSGHALSNICASITATTGAGGLGPAFAVTNSHGLYSTANLSPGHYEVAIVGQFTRNRGCRPSGYADQFFRAVGLAGTPDQVDVKGGTPTTGVDVALARSGEISGVIKSKAGRPVPHFCATAVGVGSTFSNTVFAGNGGRYVINGIPAGRYQVEFTNCFASAGIPNPPDFANQWYAGSATQRTAKIVKVAADRATPHIDAALTSGGSIAGQVLFQKNKRPVSFVCVEAVMSQTVVGATLTDRRGRYLLAGLTPGRVRLAFMPCISESALGAQWRAGTLTVVAGHTVSGVDEVLPVGGTVTGVVRHGNGATARRAPGTCIEFLPLTSTGFELVTNTVGGGRYAASYLAPGRYLPVFGNPLCSFNATSLSELATAPVTVRSARTTGQVNATLLAAGGISGTVRGPGGHPIAGICAEAFPQGGDLTGPLAPVVGISTGSGYAINGLQPGKYKVSFSPGCGATGYATRWYKNATSAKHASVVTVRADVMSTGISVTLPRV